MILNNNSNHLEYNFQTIKILIMVEIEAVSIKERFEEDIAFAD